MTWTITVKNNGPGNANSFKVSFDDDSNPNGALKNIAGILNKEKNILGMMPHPERMIDKYLSGEDGSIFFKNLLNNLKI